MPGRMKIMTSLLVVASLGATARADFVVGVPPPVTFTPKARVDHAVAAYAGANAFQGAVVVVMDHGTMRQYFYGSRDAVGTPFDHTTAVEIGSNTKTFTATALAYVDHYGIMDKDSYVHTWAAINAGSPPHAATLMDLADHHSGLPRSSGDPTLPGFPGPYLTEDMLMASLNHCASWSSPCVAPGQGLYSNYAYQVLGNIMSHYLGYPTWSAMNTSLITDPLGMSRTCVHGDGCNSGFNANHAHPFSSSGAELPINPSDPIGAPAGSLWSTADDMATWLKFNLGEATTSSSWPLDALRPELRTRPAGLNTGFAWNFKSVTFSDGTSSTVRWKNGRLQGLVSYIGLADSRDTAVFVFVNRDPVASTSDPDDDGSGTVVDDQLGQPILQQFP
jgi:CubicO group peptidase (beta-lactamase class C family)